jgi:hypothetical protein
MKGMVVPASVQIAVRVGVLPQQPVVQVQQDGSASGRGERRCGVHVVVVGVGADDGGQPPIANGLGDGIGVVGSVDHDDLVFVPDDP